MKYQISDTAIFIETPSGFKALWDDEGIYEREEFVSYADFNTDAFEAVEINED